MATPSAVSAFSTKNDQGEEIKFTISNEVMDFHERARPFGASDLRDATGIGQRRVIAVPDRRSGTVTPMVLSLGSQNTLHLVRADSATRTGWRITDLTPGLVAGTRSGMKVRCVGAAFTTDDRIAVAVALDPAAGEGPSQILVAFDLSSARTDWENIRWTDAGTRDTVVVSGLRVLEHGDKSWMVILAGSEGEVVKLYLMPSWMASRGFSASVVFNAGTTIHSLSDVEPGASYIGSGLNIAARTGQHQALHFRPFPKIDALGNVKSTPSVIKLPAPEDAVVLARGAVRAPGSDLYLGGKGVYRISAETYRKPANAALETVIEPDSAPAVRDLVVAEGRSGAVAVWACLQNGDLLVARRQPKEPWGAPLRIRTDVIEIAPVMGDDQTTTSLLLVYSDGHASHLWQDAATDTWQETALLVDTTDPPGESSMATMTCYSSYLRLLDADGSPLVGVDVELQASMMTMARCNGRTVFLGPVLPAKVKTDRNGGIQLLNRARSLTPATYRCRIPGIAQTLDINPAAPLHQRFQTLTEDELRKATFETSTSTSKQHVLPEEFRTGARRGEVAGMVAALNQAAKLTHSAGQVAPGVRLANPAEGFNDSLQVAAPVVAPVLAIEITEAGIAHADPGLISSLWQGVQKVGTFFKNVGDSIGDFFEAIANKTWTGLKFLVHKVGDAWECICAWGDSIKRFVLNTIAQIGTFFRGLWELVKVTVEAVWKYVKWLLSWDDVVRVRDLFVRMAKGGLDYFDTQLEGVQGLIHKVSADLKKVVVGMRSDKLPPLPGDNRQLAEQVKKDAASGREQYDGAIGHSASNWVLDGIRDFWDNIIHIDGELPDLDLGDLVLDPAREAIDTLLEVGGGICEDLVALCNGKSLSEIFTIQSLHELFQAVGTQLLNGLIGLTDRLATRVIGAVRMLIKTFRAVLFTNVSFPFIETLAKFFFKDAPVSTKCNLGEALMTLVALPATVVYKLIYGEAPVLEGEVIPIAFGSGVTAQAARKGKTGKLMRIGVIAAKIIRDIKAYIDAGSSAVGDVAGGMKSTFDKVLQGLKTAKDVGLTIFKNDKWRIGHAIMVGLGIWLFWGDYEKVSSLPVSGAATLSLIALSGNIAVPFVSLFINNAATPIIQCLLHLVRIGLNIAAYFVLRTNGYQKEMSSAQEISGLIEDVVEDAANIVLKAATIEGLKSYIDKLMIAAGVLHLLEIPAIIVHEMANDPWSARAVPA